MTRVDEKVRICREICGARCCRRPIPCAVTIFDIYRLSRYLKCTALEFVERFCVPKRFTELTEYHMDSHESYIETVVTGSEEFEKAVFQVFTDPKKALLMYHSFVWLTLRSIEGACVFLDKNTNLCTVHEVKPIQCKVYPLSVITSQVDIALSSFLTTGIGVIRVPSCKLLEKPDLLRDERELLSQFDVEFKFTALAEGLFIKEFIARFEKIVPFDALNLFFARAAEELASKLLDSVRKGFIYVEKQLLEDLVKEVLNEWVEGRRR